MMVGYEGRCMLLIIAVGEAHVREAYMQLQVFVRTQENYVKFSFAWEGSQGHPTFGAGELTRHSLSQVPIPLACQNFSADLLISLLIDHSSIEHQPPSN